jgi:hypothetical protein
MSSKQEWKEHRKGKRDAIRLQIKGYTEEDDGWKRMEMQFLVKRSRCKGRQEEDEQKSQATNFEFQLIIHSGIHFKRRKKESETVFWE